MSSTVQMILEIAHEVGSRYLGERDQKIHIYSLMSRLMYWSSSQVPHALS